MILCLLHQVTVHSRRHGRWCSLMEVLGAGPLPSSGVAVASDSVTPLCGGVSPHIAWCISLLSHVLSGDVRMKDSR